MPYTCREQVRQPPRAENDPVISCIYHFPVDYGGYAVHLSETDSAKAENDLSE